MTVEAETAAAHLDHEGVTYHFCALRCRDRFQADPGKYLAPGYNPAGMMEWEGEALPGVMWVCPMCPEVREPRPVPCPKCGMALEPEGVDLSDGPSPELLDMTRRLRWAAGPALATFVLGMSEMIPGQPLHRALGASAVAWLSLVLSAPVVWIAGWPFFLRAWESLKSRAFNMFTLIGLGVATAWGYSAVATLAPGLFPPELRGHGGAIPVYFEASAVIVALVLVGQVLELRARGQTRSALRGLLSLVPPQARRVRDDGEDDVIPLSEVKVGDWLRVRPGEHVPVDGTVWSGSSSVDESFVTGEPIPALKEEGSTVMAGTLNGQGSLVMEATAVGSSTLVARIVEMVAQASRTTAPIQRVADRVSGIFVPVVVAIAAASFVGWWALGPAPSLAWALVAAVSVLIVACPCALGLATPMSISVAVGRGARAGLLVRQAEALEVLEKADVLVFDKTGTLTVGKPTLAEVWVSAPFGEGEVLSLAASLEKGSEHPLAAAVVQGAQARGVGWMPTSGFRSTPGRGIVGEVGGRRVQVGSVAFLGEQGVATDDAGEVADAWAQQGRSVVAVAVDGALAGLLGVEDPLRPGARDAVDALKAEGIHLVLCSGDGRAAVERIASQLGITDVHAQVLPEGKKTLIDDLRARGHVVAMAGDGVNDAPALASAHVGLAMGSGTDLARASAGIVLLRSDLAGLLAARRLSRKTLDNIRQNLFFAFAYNVVGISVAAGLLYPFFGVLLSPMIASAAMSLSSVSVITNALRLRSVEI